MLLKNDCTKHRSKLKLTRDENISIRMIKLCGKSNCKPLQLIFIHSLRTGPFPIEWKKSNLVPLHKQGQKQCLKTYWLVSVVLICRKILQRLLFDKKKSGFLLKTIWFSQTNFVSSQETPVLSNFYFTHEFYQSFSDEFEVRGAFLDITKPFNWVWHKSVIVKHKVSEHSFKQNRSMLKNMTVLLYTYFYNIYLNILKPFSFNIYNLPFLHSPNIGKIMVKTKNQLLFLLHGPLNQQNCSFQSFFFTDMYRTKRQTTPWPQFF